MDLDVAGGDRRDAAMAAKCADLATNDDRVAFLQTQLQRVLFVYQHVVAAGAVERIAGAMDDAVELFAASGREPQLTVVRRRINFDNGKPGAAIRRRELRRDPSVGVPSFAQALSAPLYLVAGLLQFLNAVVGGRGKGDLVADRLSVLEVNQARRRRLHTLGDQRRDFPFRLRFADAATGDFGAEKYSALSRRFGPAAALFVARLRRQQQNHVVRLDEHLRAENDVLMDSRRNALNRFANEIRFWQSLEKVSAADVKPIDAPVVRRFDHFDRVQPAMRRNIEFPQFAHSSRAFFVDRDAARKLIGRAADFGATLHAGMAA